MTEKVKKNTKAELLPGEKVIPAAEATKEAVEIQSPKVEQRIYIGPNMLQLTSYTVVESDFPLHIKELFKKCPSVEKLFVPVAELTIAEPRTKKSGTMEHRHYRKVLEFINGKQGE